ncbi:MAG: aminodeoxychorismate synthase component I [Candidatus Auribacterota bacterium]|nr:aminodeoxychorismate synthase component I [Candidatus Auribacterota bacterium]
MSKTKKYYPSPILEILDKIRNSEKCVFLDTNRYDMSNSKSYFLAEPVKEIICYKKKDVRRCFEEIERLSEEYFVAGYMSYELGFILENMSCLKTCLKTCLKKRNIPLFEFTAFKKCTVYNHTKPLEGTEQPDVFSPRLFEAANLKLNIEYKEYLKKIFKIKKYIEEGKTYQLNFTSEYVFDFTGCPYSFYLEQREKQKVSYGAMIKNCDSFILSFSPELFFRKKDRKIEARPMKGTAPRGKDVNEDFDIANNLQNDIKNRSENVMILDLFRNDFGKVCENGSVKVKKIFSVEKYETLFQMISSVEGTLLKNVSLYDVIKAIFPSGSVTGAPKIISMKLLKELEKRERGIYTGAIGFFGPQGTAEFNVPIRTIVLTGSNGRMGVGSGIVYDSDAGKEFEECKLKALFLASKKDRFFLVETMRWERKFWNLSFHLRRLRKTAEYFGYACVVGEIDARLKKLENSFQEGMAYKVRMLLDKTGGLRIVMEQIEKTSGPQKVCFSLKHTYSNDRFLYHKTTNRKLYQGEYEYAKKRGYFDVIFRNEKGEVTEGSISNIFIEKEGIVYTPPLKCGLLNGIYRQKIMIVKDGIIEKVLSEKNMREADNIYLTNSVRGIVRVALD